MYVTSKWRWLGSGCAVIIRRPPIINYYDYYQLRHIGVTLDAANPLSPSPWAERLNEWQSLVCAIILCPTWSAPDLLLHHHFSLSDSSIMGLGFLLISFLQYALCFPMCLIYWQMTERYGRTQKVIGREKTRKMWGIIDYNSRWRRLRMNRWIDKIGPHEWRGNFAQNVHICADGWNVLLEERHVSLNNPFKTLICKRILTTH